MIELIQQIKEEIARSKKEYAQLEQTLNAINEKVQYEKAKQRLRHDRQLNFWRAFSQPGMSAEELRQKLRSNHQERYKIPKNISLFLQSFKKVDESSCFFANDLDDFYLDENQGILEGIEDGIYPEFMKRFLPLSGTEGFYIGTWLYDQEVEDSEILLFDYESQSIEIASNSMKNFTRRALECYRKGIEQDIFDLSEEALEIVESIEGDNFFSDSIEYSLILTEDYPEHWREIVADS